MKLEVLEKDHYYHIYNRGINGCKIFMNDSNYDYFINLFFKYLTPHLTVYAYCLLSNHFHFVVRIDTEHKIVSQKLSNFLNAYVKAFNKADNRTGSLFEKPFKRIKLHSEDYLINLIIYVNTNPLRHKITFEFENYLYSSYSDIVNENSRFIKVNEVLELFHDIENFKFIHQNKKVVLSDKFTLDFF